MGMPGAPVCWRAQGIGVLAALEAWEDLAAKGAQGLLVRYRCGAVRSHLWWRVFGREKFGDALKLWALRQEAQGGGTGGDQVLRAGTAESA